MDPSKVDTWQLPEGREYLRLANDVIRDLDTVEIAESLYTNRPQIGTTWW